MKRHEDPVIYVIGPTPTRRVQYVNKSLVDRLANKLASINVVLHGMDPHNMNQCPVFGDVVKERNQIDELLAEYRKAIKK